MFSSDKQAYEIKDVFPVFILSLIGLVFLTSYWTTVNSYYSLWFANDNSIYSHGILILGLVIWFTYKRLQENHFKVVIRLNYFSCICILFLSCSWLIFDLGNIQLGQQLALFTISIALLISLFGLKQYIHLFISSLLIILTIPVWDYLNFTLRQISIAGVSELLSFTNILFYVEGFHITLPNGRFHVDTGCSGLNQLISGVSISVIYTLINHVKFKYSILFVTAGVLFSLLSNTIRILIIIISGHLTNMQHYFVTTDHVTLGWVVFSILIFIYILVANKILDRYPCLMKKDDGIYSYKNEAHYSAKELSIMTLLIVIFLISGPFISARLKSQHSNLDDQFNGLPECIGDWCVSENMDFLRSGSSYKGEDKYVSALYEKDDTKIYCEIYVYSRQEQGKEAINDKNRIYDKKEWLFSRFLKAKNLNFSPTTQLMNQNSGENGIIRYWYHTNNKHLDNPLKSKIENIIGLISGHPEILVFILTTDAGWNEAESIESIDELTQLLTSRQWFK